jgi:hypothetical protein
MQKIDERHVHHHAKHNTQENVQPLETTFQCGHKSYHEKESGGEITDKGYNYRVYSAEQDRNPNGCDILTSEALCFVLPNNFLPGFGIVCQRFVFPKSAQDTEKNEYNAAAKDQQRIFSGAFRKGKGT